MSVETPHEGLGSPENEVHSENYEAVIQLIEAGIAKSESSDSWTEICVQIQSDGRSYLLPLGQFLSVDVYKLGLRPDERNFMIDTYVREIKEHQIYKPYGPDGKAEAAGPDY